MALLPFLPLQSPLGLLERNKMCSLTLPWCAHCPGPLLIPTQLSPWGCCPLLGLGTSWCHPSAAVVGGLPAAAHGIVEDFGKTACVEGVGFLPTLTHRGCGLGPVGESRTGGAAGVHRGSACRSVAAGFSLHLLLPPCSCWAGKHYCPQRPASFLLLLVITAVRPRVSCPLLSPSWCHRPGVTLLAQNSRS